MRLLVVRRSRLDVELRARGFTPVRSGGEVVYEKAHHGDPRLIVRVYTGVPWGEDRVVGGEGAIRVGLSFRPGIDHRSGRGLLRSEPVSRKAPNFAVLLGRLVDKIAEAYRFASGMTACHRCRGVTFPDSHRCVDKACRLQSQQDLKAGFTWLDGKKYETGSREFNDASVQGRKVRSLTDTARRSVGRQYGQISAARVAELLTNQG